jgi:hypothetical protein
MEEGLPVMGAGGEEQARHQPLTGLSKKVKEKNNNNNKEYEY